MSNAARRGLPQRVRMRHDNHFVETLAARGEEESIGRMLPLSSVEPDPMQPRSAMGDLSDLTESIRERGVLEPILVRVTPADEEGKTPFRIISGERRYRAAMAASRSEIPVIVMDVNEEEALEIALIENLQRKDLTPFEEAEGYQALAERFDYTQEAIAKSVGKSRTVVTESMALLKLPSRVREAAMALGIHTKSVLLEVLKEEDEEAMIRLLEDVARRGLSRDDLRRKQRAPAKGTTKRRKPYVFNFRAPDKRFNLALRFRQSSVSKDELIHALESILAEVRTAS